MAGQDDFNLKEGDDDFTDCPICMCSYQETHHKLSMTNCCNNSFCSECESKVADMLRGLCPFCRRQATENRTMGSRPSSSAHFEENEFLDFDDYFDDVFLNHFGHRRDRFIDFSDGDSDHGDSDYYDSDQDDQQTSQDRFLNGVAQLLRGERVRRRRLKPMQRICEHFQNGRCRRGDRCTFAHGQSALRQHNMPSAGGDSRFLDFEESARKELQQIRSNGGAKEYPSTLTSYERKVIHMLSEQLGLRHRSYGMGEERAIKVWDGLMCPFQCEIERQRAVLPECRVAINRVTTNSRKFRGSSRSHHEICFELVEPAIALNATELPETKASPAVARRKKKAERKKRQSKAIEEKPDFMTEEEYLNGGIDNM